MPSAPQSPPVTPNRAAMAIQSNVRDEMKDTGKEREERQSDGLEKQLETLAVKTPTAAQDETQVTSSHEPSGKVDEAVPPVTTDQEKGSGHQASHSPNMEDLQPLDWEDFEARYISAMQVASQKENDILNKFDRLVKYFNVWADASSNFDYDRALKRIKTREEFVQNAEQDLEKKKQHYIQVVDAFSKALELLGG